jgi:hypothetical protein
VLKYKNPVFDQNPWIPPFGKKLPSPMVCFLYILRDKKTDLKDANIGPLPF